MSSLNRIFGKKESRRRQFDPNQFSSAFEHFANASAWDESQCIVESTPLLLDPQADELLPQYAEAQSDPRVRQMVEEYGALLRRCREVGIPRAFAEKMLPPEALAQAEDAGIAPEQALEMARAAVQMPPELAKSWPKSWPSWRRAGLRFARRKTWSAPWPSGRSYVVGWRRSSRSSASQHDSLTWRGAPNCTGKH